MPITQVTQRASTQEILSESRLRIVGRHRYYRPAWLEFNFNVPRRQVREVYWKISVARGCKPLLEATSCVQTNQTLAIVRVMSEKYPRYKHAADIGLRTVR